MKEIRRGNIHKLFACAKVTNEYSLLLSGVVSVWVWLRTLVCVGVAENYCSVCVGAGFWEDVESCSSTHCLLASVSPFIITSGCCKVVIMVIQTSDSSKQFHSLSCGLDERCP